MRAAAAAPLRVLLVEDDASIRRYVALALEDEPVVLTQAASMAAAIEALRQGPYGLLLCDLMLPDGNGFDLLKALAEPDAPSAGARRVVFSAGVSAEMRARLQAIGVHEVLSKPASLADLLACVHAAAAAPLALGTNVPASPTPPADAHAERAVAGYFGGDRALYLAFLASCRLQWPVDVALGDQAQAGGDLPALRRLGHSLKSVLQSLGLDEDATWARRLEAAVEAGRATEAAEAWARLRGLLLARVDAGHVSGDAGSPGC